MTPVRPPALPQILFFVLGFVPIGALSASLFEFLPLHLGARAVVLPAAILTILLAVASPTWGRRAAFGYAAGVAATGAYDITRLALVYLGVWPDFIPPLGRLVLLDQHASPIWGYAWRFLGNGGGMGMAFAMLPFRGAVSGMIYGLAICGCLFFTLIVAPHAQSTLFVLGPITAAASILGHLDYGGVLGLLCARWLPIAPPAVELGHQLDIDRVGARVESA